MSIEVKVDLKEIESKFNEASKNKGQIALANQMLIDFSKYVPRRKGNLEATGHVINSGQAIVYNTVYARAHFYGTNGIVVFRKYTTPGTGSKWSEKAAASNMQKWENVAMKGMGL